jgi:uncharacterized protein (DUF2225 family)
MNLADISVSCPECGSKFNSRQVPIYLDFGHRNSELRQDFNNPAQQFEPYEVCTCPTCGKSDWMISFPPTTELSTLKQPYTTAHLQYRNAALNAERTGKKMYDVAFFYLYAAWCADDAAAYPQAREYRRMAADGFRKSLVDSSCSFTQRPEIEYLIGELLRRAGEFEASQEHFKSVIGHLPAKFALMARKLVRLSEQRNTEPIPFEFSR